MTLLVVLAAAATLLAPGQQNPPGDKTPVPSLTGKWSMELAMAMGPSTPTLVLKQDGEKITGTYTGRYGAFPLEGTIKGHSIEFSVTITVENEKVEMSFAGTVATDGQSMGGKADLAQAGEGTWVARRDKAPAKAEGTRQKAEGRNELTLANSSY